MLESKTAPTSLPAESDSKPENSEKLTQRAYLNAIAAMLGFAVTGVTSLFLNPFMVRALGSTYYGILQIIQQMTTFMTAADGRPTQALKWFIANQQGTTDYVAKKQAIGGAMFIWLIFSPVVLTVGGILVWLSPAITKVSLDLHLMVRLTTVFYAIDILVTGIAILPAAVLQGMNLGYKRMMLAPFFVVLSAMLTVGAILLGLSVPGIAAAALVADLITGVVWWGIIRSLLPWFGVARPSPAGLRRFIAVSGWFFCWTLINKVMLNGDVVVLGMVAGPEAVTTFALTGYVARMVVDLLALALGSVMPGLGMYIGRERYAAARAIRHEMLSMNWLLCVSIGVSILLWNQSFLGLWVGTEYYAGTLANLMIVWTVLQLTLIRNDAFIIDLTLNLRRKVLLGGLSVLLSLALAAILIPPLGIVGLCLGLLVGRSILSIGYPVLVDSALKLSSQRKLKHLARPAVATAVLFAASTYLGQYLLVKGWFQFLVYGCLSFACAFGVAIMAGLTMSERKAIVARVGKIHLFGRG